LALAILESRDMTLVGAVSRSKEGHRLDEVLNVESPLVISGTVEEALNAATDVLIDFTSPAAVKADVLTAIRKKVHVVVGTSGLTDADYQDINRRAKRKEVGVVAVGNFAISAVLMEYFASVAARFMPSWEVIDYATDAKPDAPSGTVRELAYALAKVRSPQVRVPIKDTVGAKESRGHTVSGTQVHSVRLPGYVIAAEVVFGKNGERLLIRHEAGGETDPYVSGVLLAARRVSGIVGVQRGLAQFLDLAPR
jgi:4-hydroxy-tetrahydrodipicolinate reductase